MAAWTTIPDSDVDPESPITTGLMTALRDNPQAMGEGASGAPPIRIVLFTDSFASGNTGAGEDDIATYTLPADTLKAAGDRLHVRAAFYGNNTDNVTVKFYLGSTSITIFTGGTLDTLAGRELLVVDIEIIMVAAGLQRIALTGIYGDDLAGAATGAVTTYISSWVEDETTNLTVKFTGENDSDASNNAVINAYMAVEYSQANP